MKTFWNVLKNDWLRSIPMLDSLLLVTFITLASIVLAVYMTGMQQVKGHIAFITTDTSAASVPKSSSALEIIRVSKKPPRSALMQQKYDAFVWTDSAGHIQVETLRTEKFRKMVLLLLQHPKANVTIGTERSTGENVIGFMMMFLLMMAFAGMEHFGNDREQGQLQRIATAPVSFGGYLTGHTVYCLMLMVPEFLILIILKAFGWKIGFTLPQYAGIMLVLGFLGTSLALFLHTVILKPDNANMLGNSITVLTSVMAGCFYTAGNSNATVDALISVLPQKQMMKFAQALQAGTAWQNSFYLLYPILFAAVLFGISCFLLRKKYVKL